MQRSNPIYTIRKDTCLASDPIITYGGRVKSSSESRTKAIALKLLTIKDKKSENDE